MLFVPLIFNLVFLHTKGPQVHQDPNFNSVVDLTLQMVFIELFTV